MLGTAFPSSEVGWTVQRAKHFAWGIRWAGQLQKVALAYPSFEASLQTV
jgi:hypothetical protein